MPNFDRGGGGRPDQGRKMAEMMVARIPQAEYVVVPGAGHALCLDKPEPLNTLLWALC